MANYTPTIATVRAKLDAGGCLFASDEVAVVMTERDAFARALTHERELSEHAYAALRFIRAYPNGVGANAPSKVAGALLDGLANGRYLDRLP